MALNTAQGAIGTTPIGILSIGTLAAPSGTTIEVPTGGFTYTGLAPVLILTNNILVSVPTGSYTFSGLAPTIITVAVTTSDIRTLVVVVENRTVIILAETRTLPINSENRTMRA